MGDIIYGQPQLRNLLLDQFTHEIKNTIKGNFLIKFEGRK